METIKIDQRSETNSRANKRLRNSGYLPGSIYGKGIEDVPVSIKKDEFRQILTKLGRNSVFELEVADDNSYTVVIKEIQNDPISREVLHVDFQRILLNEEIQTDVAVRISGAEAIEKNRLLVMLSLDMVTVKSLPQSIPESITIDVSELNAGDTVTIGDLNLPEGVVAEHDADVPVVVITEPKAYEEVEEDGNAEPEVIGQENSEE